MAKQTQPRPTKTGKAAKSQSKTKSDKIVHLLKRSSGATIAEIQKQTGWQAHSVRGFLSGTIKKRMGHMVSSQKVEGAERRYRITEEATA